MSERTFVRARILGNMPSGTDQRRIVLEPPDEAFLASYTTPGQHCVMRAPGGESGHYAMLSAPGQGARLDFLLKTGRPAADAIVALRAGSYLEACAPEGKGFDLSRARGSDVLLVGTGTGIAPLRAALVHMLAHRDDYGGLALVYGVRTPAHVAIAHDLDLFRDASVEVHVVYSAHETLRRSYVQDLVRVRFADHLGVLLAVGQTAMIEDLRRIDAEAGGDGSCILLSS